MACSSLREVGGALASSLRCGVGVAWNSLSDVGGALPWWNSLRCEVGVPCCSLRGAGPTPDSLREVGVPGLLSRRSLSSWGVALLCLTPGLPLLTLLSSPRCRDSLVRGPRAVDDIELLIPSKKSLEGGRREGDVGARERGAELDGQHIHLGL